MEIFVPQLVLQEMTQRSKFAAQYRVLCRMGFRAVKYPNGEPKVTWENFRAVTGGIEEISKEPEVVLHPETL